jgi:putative peptidoglycan lipid II flippase
LSLLRNTALVSVLTLLSRLFGFIRDLIVAALLGSTLFADAFFIAFRIPNLLRSVFAEGALSAAFIPVFTDARNGSLEKAQSTFSAILTILVLATITVSLIGIFLAERVVTLIAPGFLNSETFSLTVTLTKIMFPYIVFVSVVSLLNGTLNSFNIFGSAAFAQVLMNVTLIGGALFAFTTPIKEEIVQILAISVIIGGVIQVLAQLPSLRKINLRFKGTFLINTSESKLFLKLFFPALFGATIYQINIFLLTLYTSFLPEGSASYLFYADRVTQLPLGVFSIALSSVLLPMLANAESRKDGAAKSEHLQNALRFSIFLLIPLIAILMVSSLPIVRLLFERGAFRYAASVETAKAIFTLAPSILFVTLHSLYAKAFIARGDNFTPAISGIFSLLVTIVLAPLLTDPKMGLFHAGLGLSSTISSATALCFLMVRLKSVSLFLPLFKSALAILPGIFLVLSFTKESSLLNLILACSTLSVTYFISSLILKNRESYETLSLINRLVRRYR